MEKSCMTCIVAGLALLALGGLEAGSAVAQIPTLTHEWNFDGNFNDSVGTKNADALGTGTAVSTTGGVAGGAAYFDGSNDLLYVAGRDAIPQGPFTLSFWEYCTDPENQGYFVSDAATSPDWENENLMLRRRSFYFGGGDTHTTKAFAETGLKSVYYGNWWAQGGTASDGYWDLRNRDLWMRPTEPSYFDPRLNQDLPTGEWVHHVITYYQPTIDGGWGEWYVNGQINTWGPRLSIGAPGGEYGTSVDPFTGLKPLDPNPETDPSAYNYFPNRREGFVIGNLIDNTNIDNYNEHYVDNERVGPTGNYRGYIDDFQVYNGTVTPDQVRYLRDHPGANLTTYTAPAPSAQPKTAHLYRWKFDGNFNEEGGSGYNGAVVSGTPTAGTTGGRIGGAAYFDGDNDTLQIDKNVLTDGAFSLVFWTKEQLLGDGRQLCEILSDGAGTSGLDDLNLRLLSRFQPYGQPGGRNIRIFCGDVVYAATGEFGKDGMSETLTWPYEEWHQHAFIMNSEGDTQWYVNNVLMSPTPALPFEGLVYGLFLGSRSNQLGDFKGYIDDLQIYNWDINADEVAFLWNNPGSALTITGGTPVYQPYDVNEDGFVGADDLDVVRAHWGESGPGGKAIGDINLDEFVGADDLDQLRAHWGEVCPPIPGLVPEPSTFVLLLMGALALIAVRRVR